MWGSGSRKTSSIAIALIQVKDDSSSDQGGSSRDDKKWTGSRHDSFNMRCEVRGEELNDFKVSGQAMGRQNCHSVRWQNCRWNMTEGSARSSGRGLLTLFPLDVKGKLLKRQLQTRVWDRVLVGSIPGNRRDAELENIHSLDTGRL